MRRINELIAVKITLAVSTMWAFYALVLYGLTPLVWPQYMSKILYWSNFIQLVFLPLLAVGTAVMSRATKQRDQETHDAVMSELAELKALHAELHREVTHGGGDGYRRQQS
ncbi:MAG: hypothetical protein K6T78_12280 [Alicyclobacillus sp.]|nr:hypothetical protein [Alicyclobacillus sp.]